MTKSSETGHLRNLTNFAKLISYVNALGESYRPPKDSIKVDNLQVVYDLTSTVLDEMTRASAAYSLAVDKRKLAFKPMSKLVTRIYNNLKASDSPEMIDESVKSIARRLKGQRLSAIFTPEEIAALEAEGKSAKQISSSQMGYDTRLYNFDKFISLLSAIPEYKPYEADLKIEALQAVYAELYMLNMQVINANTELNRIRSRRQEMMYNKLGGLIALAVDVKAYVRSMSGQHGNIIKLIIGLPFTFIG